MSAARRFASAPGTARLVRSASGMETPIRRTRVTWGRRYGLARAGPAHESSRLAGTDADANITQDAALRPFDPEADRQAVDFEQRLGGADCGSGLSCARLHGVHRRACACSNSRSPSTLNAITTATMQPPAASAGSG